MSSGSQSLAIGWVHPGQVAAPFMESVCELLISDGLLGPKARIVGRGARIAVHSGPRIASARNEIVKHFLSRTSAHWLLMLDTDMVFGPEAVDKLFEAADEKEAPIVGGLCFGGGRSGLMFPTMYRLSNGPKPVEVIEEYPQDALCQVDATGAAFLLMHRGALQRMWEKYPTHYPWFIEGTAYKSMTFGEDWAFPVDPATPVLGADWRWRELASFVPGESVLGFDEHSPLHSSRRFQEAQVTHLIERRLPRLRIVTDEGEIITTAEHPWLARPFDAYPEKTGWRWTPAGQLQPGMTIASVTPKAENPDISELQYAAGYLQGLLHSDGTRMAGRGSPNFVVRMKDTEPLERAATMSALLGIESVRGEARWDGNDRHAPMHRWGIYRRESAEIADRIWGTTGFPSKLFAAGYLAGMYDGDGHHDGASLTISSVVEGRKDRLEEAARLIGIPFTARTSRVVRMSSQESTFRFWQQTLPSLGRRTGVLGQRGNDGVRRGKEVLHRPVTVRAVEKMPVGDVACLTTTSGTFVADGLGSHNCMRAKEMGLRIFVHTGAKVGHIKAQVLDEDAYRDFRAKRDDLGGEAQVAEEFRKKVSPLSLPLPRQLELVK